VQHRATLTLSGCGCGEEPLESSLESIAYCTTALLHYCTTADRSDVLHHCDQWTHSRMLRGIQAARGPHRRQDCSARVLRGVGLGLGSFVRLFAVNRCTASTSRRRARSCAAAPTATAGCAAAPSLRRQLAPPRNAVIEPFGCGFRRVLGGGPPVSDRHIYAGLRRAFVQ